MCVAQIYLWCHRAECYDYLFDMGVQMRNVGLDTTAVPVYCDGAYTLKVHLEENNQHD